MLSRSNTKANKNIGGVKMKISHILFTEEQTLLITSDKHGTQENHVIDGKHSLEDYLIKFNDPRKQTDIPVHFEQSAFIL